VSTLETIDGTSVPILRLAGSPTDCGQQYGTEVKSMISWTIETYLGTFRDQHGLTEEAVFDLARKFEPVIEEYDRDLLEEMAGIAAGAAVPLEAIVAINARSELMHGLKAKLDEGCTSFAILPSATSSGHVLMGQNWDWKSSLRQSTVLLDIRRLGIPRVLTVTEAGLVGKFGLNEAGLGLCINFLLSDTRRFGMPVHVIRRRVLSAWTLGEAMRGVFKANRALAANYLIAHADGEAFSLEAFPEDVDVVYPKRARLTHANHFKTCGNSARDLGKSIFPDSLVRDHRANRELQKYEDRVDIEACTKVLSDHFNHPESICRHGNLSLPAEEQIETLGSAVMDLNERVMFFCTGPPCENRFAEIKLDFNTDEIVPSSRVEKRDRQGVPTA
jgi:isopenicillin-N N-acyltransferase like protein